MGPLLGTGRSTSYWPWVQILRDSIEKDREVLRAEFNPALGQLSRILPELSETGNDLSSGEAKMLGPFRNLESDHFRFFDSVSVVLRKLAGKHGLLLVMDDLHAADPDSLQLLGFLARDIRRSAIVVAITYRDTEVEQSPRHGAFLAEIARGGQLFQLGGLSELEVESFLSSNSIDPKRASEFRRVSGGNPFFLQELARQVSAGSPAAAFTRVITAASVRSMVQERVALLSTNARRVLSTASVLGSEFDSKVLEQATSMPSADVLAALNEARSHSLITSIDDTPGFYRFKHGVLQESIKAELDELTLCQVHRDLAQALRKIHGNRVQPQLAAIANHYFLALPVASLEEVANAAREAAEWAFDQLAYEEAARLFRMSLQVTESAGEEAPERIELMLRLGDAEHESRNFEEARRIFRSVASIAQRLARPDLLARAPWLLAKWAEALDQESSTTNWSPLQKKRLQRLVAKTAHIEQFFSGGLRSISTGQRSASMRLLSGTSRLRWRGVSATQPPWSWP